MADDMIYRQAAINLIQSFSATGYIEEETEKIVNALKELPSAEAEIICCKDCKYYNPIGVCIEMNCAVCEDSFCCWAERRLNEHGQ